MAWRDTTPVVPNTTMQIYTNTNGNDVAYKITPNDGYIMHNKNRDKVTYDGNGNVILSTPGFTSAPTTCAITYDFTTSIITLENGETVIVYGVNEYFTVLAEDLPEEGIIYGGTTPKPEIM